MRMRQILVGAAGAALTLAVVATSLPAQAGWWDGDISNWLPPNYFVHIGSFEAHKPRECTVWTPYSTETYPCRHWWLPSGKADDQIRGRNFDTDGFMIDSPYVVKIRPVQGGDTYSVPAFKWTRFHNGTNVNCRLEAGTPTCTIR